MKSIISILLIDQIIILIINVTNLSAGYRICRGVRTAFYKKVSLVWQQTASDSEAIVL